MAALMDIPGHRGGWSVDRGASELHARGATEPDPTGPAMFAEAALLLPEVVGCGPVRCVDVHTALYQAACLQGTGRDRPHRLRLADAALDQLASYLGWAGLAEPAGRSKDTVRGWLVHVDQLQVRLVIAAAGQGRGGGPIAPIGSCSVDARMSQRLRDPL